MTTIPDRLRIESVERNENGPYYRMGDGSWVKHYQEASPFGNHDLARGERHSTPGTCDRWITDHDEARVIWNQIKALDASLSPLDGEGGAADVEAAPPEPLYKGAPERALRDMTEQEIRGLTSDEFMAAQLEDNCVGCPEAPRSTCSLRMHCEAKAYGVGDGSD